jgi:hypothetical protein
LGAWRCPPAASHLEQGEIAFLVGRNLAERVQRPMRKGEHMSSMPFDGRWMIFGGFETFLEV